MQQVLHLNLSFFWLFFFFILIGNKCVEDVCSCAYVTVEVCCIIFAWLLLEDQRMAALSFHFPPFFCTLSSTNVWTATRWSFWLLALIILDGNDTMALAFKCRLSALLWGQHNNSDGLFGLWSRVKCKPWPVPVFWWCSYKITSDCSYEQPGKRGKKDSEIHPPSVEDLKLSYSIF